MTARPAADAGARAELVLQLVLQLSRELRRSLPAPRGAPYFGLDIDTAFSPAVFESLSDPGIFRKYELVLLLGAPHGGIARWLAMRLGCRIVVADADAGALAFGDVLNRRAHCHESVSFVCGANDRLPVRPRSFTHAWCVGMPPDLGATLRQAQAAIRPGGHFAIQCLPGDAAVADGQLVDACLGAGFEAVEVHLVETEEPPTAFRLARQRARAAAEGLRGASAGVSWSDVGSVPARLRRLHARRPS